MNINENSRKKKIPFYLLQLLFLLETGDPDPNKQANEGLFSRKLGSNNSSCSPIKFNENDISKYPPIKNT